MANFMGGIFSMLAGLGGGSEAKMEQMPTMNPQQQQMLSQLLEQLGQGGQLGGAYGQGLGQLTEMMDPSSEAMQRFSDPYMQQFNQQTVPGLAERFAGAGAQGGALSSSGFGQALGAAGGQLQTQLAGMKSELQRKAIGDIMSQFSGQAGQALGAQPFAYGKQQAEPGFFGQYAQQGFPGMQQAAKGIGDLWGNYGPIIGNV